MRILHLIHSEGLYGAEAILLYLAREQLQRGHEPIVGSIRDPGTKETQFEAAARSRALRVIPIRVPPRPTPGVVSSLLRIVQAATPHVVHSHGYKANILLGIVPRRLRGAMLATLHGRTSTHWFNRLWVYEQLDRLALRQLDSVVVVTPQMLQLRALRGIGASRLRVIENGIPPLSARLNDLETRGAAALPADLVEFTNRRPTLVAIGRLSPEKGFLLLLEAFARARREAAAQHQLLIVGDGPQRGLLESRIAELGVSGMVRLGQYVVAADRILGHAAGFVMSSVTEGMPLVLLEAMQWGVPILATAVGAIPGLLAGDRDERFWLVPPYDLAALTQGLRIMMSAFDTPGQGIVGRHAAISGRYTSARMADEYFSAYEAIT